MTVRVLPFDPNVVPQERSWDCGPASAQVILNSLGINKSEDDLIQMIGTTENGTDFVGLVEGALDKLVPDANYTSVYLTTDPATPEQKEQFWQDIVRSIDANYGVVMNFVAPPSNYPIGVDGSPNPSYGGGTIFHYVPCMGYNDEHRTVYIADPGFSPHGYWISFDQCATLVPPKGYAAAQPANVIVSPPPPPPPPAPTLPDAAVILARATGLSLARALDILPAVTSGLQAADCTNVRRIAMWLAQIGWESDNFNATEEYESGDTTQERWLYKGRTWIQLTWKSNYAGFSQWCYDRGLLRSPNYFVDHPQDLADLEWAGLGAAYYWTVARPQINSLCDNGDVVGVTEAINGGTNGLTQRTDRWNLALAQGDALLELLSEGDDEFMSDFTDRALFLLEQIAGERRASKSRFRWPHQGDVDTCAGFAWSADGFGHEDSVITKAVIYGDVLSITNLYAVANTDEAGRDDDKALATAVLEKCDKGALLAAGVQIASWVAAETANKAKS